MLTPYYVQVLAAGLGAVSDEWPAGQCAPLPTVRRRAGRGQGGQLLDVNTENILWCYFIIVKSMNKSLNKSL